MCPAEVSAATIEQQSRVSQDQKQDMKENNAKELKYSAMK